MIWRSHCIWHDFEPAIVEVEFRWVPGPIELRVLVEGFRRFVTHGWTYFTSRNEIRCDSVWGPVLGVLDLERQAVRMRHFPYQIVIPEGWHALAEDWHGEIRL